MSKAILKALNDVMAKVAYVQKTGKNNFHGYKYASEADVLEKLRPALIEAGLILIPSIKNISDIDTNGNTNITVEYTLAHKDGEIWPEKIVAVGCGNDRNKQGLVGDKGIYKALTGANKYLLFKLFQIETGDDPENDEVVAPPAKEQPKPQLPEVDKNAAAVEELNDYIAGASKILLGNHHRTTQQLQEWWKSQADNRKKLGLVSGVPEYDKLIKLVNSRKAAIESAAK